MADKKKTSELTTNSSPSTSATLVGVDNGETVQIPITEFVTKDENGCVHIRTKQGKNVIEVCETEDESYTVIQSNALQLHGVSTLRTYDDKEGKDGQVLTKKDGLVIWGDIPSLDGYAKTTDLFSKDYNDLTNKPDIPSIDGLASTSYVDTKVAGIVNSAPAALDTLNELSKALGNDANFSATVATQIGNKVDKENGKGLSTNDYTTAEKNKLAGIAEGANKYIHPDTHPASMITGLSKVATSGSYNDLTDKPTIPSSGGSGGASIIYATEKPSTPQQAIYVITADEVVKAELIMGGAVAPSPNYIEIVDELPETGELMLDMTAQTMYLYYLTTDGCVYGYVDADLSAAIEMPEGWTNAAGIGLTIINAIEEGTEGEYVLLTKAPKTRVYVPLPDGTFLELTSGIRTRFDENSGTVSITEM